MFLAIPDILDTLDILDSVANADRGVLRDGVVGENRSEQETC